MPTPISHGVFGAAVGLVTARYVSDISPWNAVVVGAIAAILPDIDVLTEMRHSLYSKRVKFRMFRHRGITHSVFVIPILWPLLSMFGSEGSTALIAAFGYLSHLLLDLFNGREGIGMFLPLTHRRFRFSWRPIRSLPLSFKVLRPGYYGQLRAGVASELTWVWSIAAVLMVLGYMF